MSTLAKHRNRDLPKTPMRGAAIAALGVSLAVLATDASTLAQEQGPAKGKIPELASTHFAWLVVGVDWLDPPAGMRGPIRPDSKSHRNPQVQAKQRIVPR